MGKKATKKARKFIKKLKLLDSRKVVQIAKIDIGILAAMGQREYWVSISDGTGLLKIEFVMPEDWENNG